MAINVFGNRANSIIAKVDISFVNAGINSDNTEIIYLIDSTIRSYMPNRSINAITSFESGKGYYVVAKMDMDLEAYVAPPVGGPLINTHALVDHDGSELSDVIIYS